MTGYFYELFSKSAGFVRKDHLFYHHEAAHKSIFEELYTDLRLKEGRLYSDETVKMLPTVDHVHPRYAEWRLRKRSAEKLVKYIEATNKKTVLEIGCGNGWLTHYLSKALPVECCGVDINERELVQAGRVFRDVEPLCFVYGNIMKPEFDCIRADVIVLAASIQYFEDFSGLIARLMGLLRAGGEVHILDSPFYADSALAAARDRSKRYFASQGFPGMEKYYHHHARKNLSNTTYRILHNPGKLLTKVRMYFATDSVFPWICIPRSHASQ